MSELMGLIYGCYDAKEHGFLPGGVSLHNAFTPHGPDAQGLYKAEEQVLEPQRYQSTLAFMLESRKFWELSPFALNSPQLQKDYLECWQGLKDRFTADS
jgi:homogentisate 1,2-dioxygenase